jgi:virulence factor MVIN family protein
LPLYGIGMYLQKVCSAMRRMTLYAVSATLGSVVQVLVLLVGTSHFGMMFVATTSAIFYVVIDTIMLISLRKHLGQIGLKSMVFAFVRSILFGLAGSAAALLIMVGLRAGIGVPDGRALYGVLYCIFAGIPAVLVTYGLAILFKSPESTMLRALVSRVRS